MSQGERLSTEVIEENRIPIVRAHGEIDMHTVREFEKALRSGIRRTEYALIVDLTDISYLDSAGLSALLGTYKALSSQNAELFVIAPNQQPGVYRVLEITRIDKVIKVRATVREAIREINLLAAA